MYEKTVAIVAKAVTVISAIFGIVVLDSIALMNGINGTLFTLAVVAIGGLGGYEIQDILKYIKGGVK